MNFFLAAYNLDIINGKYFCKSKPDSEKWHLFKTPYYKMLWEYFSWALTII